MQTPALVVYVGVALALGSVARGDTPTTQTKQPPDSVGQQLLTKQQLCDQHISDIIEEELSQDNPHAEDLPIPNEKYHECKEQLDEMKRKYMKDEKIDKATYPQYFPVKVKEDDVKMLTVPAEEEDERNEVEFDVNEELCVTSKKCNEIMELLVNNQGKDLVKFAHKQHRCQILLDTIKHRFVKERKLDEKKLKEEGGLSVTCTGGIVVESLPQTMNNADFNDAADLFSGGIPGVQLQPPTGVMMPTGLLEEPHDHLAGHPMESHGASPKPVKGVSSSAYSEKAKLMLVVLVIVAILLKQTI